MGPEKVLGVHFSHLHLVFFTFFGWYMYWGTLILLVLYCVCRNLSCTLHIWQLFPDFLILRHVWGEEQQPEETKCPGLISSANDDDNDTNHADANDDENDGNDDDNYDVDLGYYGT